MRIINEPTGAWKVYEKDVYRIEAYELKVTISENKNLFAHIIKKTDKHTHIVAYDIFVSPLGRYNDGIYIKEDRTMDTLADYFRKWYINEESILGIRNLISIENPNLPITTAGVKLLDYDTTYVQYQGNGNIYGRYDCEAVDHQGLIDFREECVPVYPSDYISEFKDHIFYPVVIFGPEATDFNVTLEEGSGDEKILRVDHSNMNNIFILNPKDKTKEIYDVYIKTENIFNEELFEHNNREAYEGNSSPFSLSPSAYTSKSIKKVGNSTYYNPVEIMLNIIDSFSDRGDRDRIVIDEVPLIMRICELTYGIGYSKEIDEKITKIYKQYGGSELKLLYKLN